MGLQCTTHYAKEEKKRKIYREIIFSGSKKASRQLPGRFRCYCLCVLLVVIQSLPLHWERPQTSVTGAQVYEFSAFVAERTKIDFIKS